MSYSSLWVLDNDFNGIELEEYGNSWLFSPILWDILFEKYLPKKARNEYGEVSFITSHMFDKTINRDLNNKINNSSNEVDRILWEISNQQVFNAKDKKFVSKCIKEFLNLYKNKIQAEHIQERFLEIANHIESLDEDEYPYFIFKNTSVDDNVEYWFREYDEEDGDCIQRPLSKLDKYVTEFVIIKNEKIVEFIDNVEYFKTLINIHKIKEEN